MILLVLTLRLKLLVNFAVHRAVEGGNGCMVPRRRQGIL